MPHEEHGKAGTTPSVKHDYVWSFLMAALPQLIPGGGIIGDYFKSFPTVFMFGHKRVLGWQGADSGFEKGFALGNAMWIGGQAAVVDILLSGFAEANNMLPYIRAFVCGSANQEFSDPYTGPGMAFWESPSSGFPYWAARLAQGDEQKLAGMRNLLAFMLGFMGTRNNVGGTPFLTGATIGLATSSALINNPLVFESNPTGIDPTYDTQDYVKLVGFYALTMGGMSNLLSSRISPGALNIFAGVLNAILQDKRILTPYVLPYLTTRVNPPHLVKTPIVPPTLNYAYY